MKEFEIRLDDINIFAHHGVYEHERREGNDFEVSLVVKYIAPDDEIINRDDIGHTISYVFLWDIVKEEMAVPRNLLETVAARIINRITEEYPYLTHAECSVCKKRPPIPDFNGKATVKYKILP